MAKRKTVEIIEVETGEEAMNYMWIGFSYYLRKHTYKTVVAILLLFGSTLYIVYDHILPDKAKIQEAKPLDEPAGMKIDLSLMPNVYAAEDGTPIIFNGKVYGYEDTDIIVKKVKDKDLFLIYNTVTKKVYSVDLYTSSPNKGF